MREIVATRLHKLSEIAGSEIPSGGHHYVIRADLLQAMGRDDVQRSVAAMIDAEMAKLPFPSLMVEFSPIPETTRFVWLKESDETIEALPAMLSARGLATVPREWAKISLRAGKMTIEGAASEADAGAIVLAAGFGLLMLHVEGVEKQLIQHSALNKARERTGKPHIPEYTLMRIGTVYDREGKPVGAGSALEHVYLRAGHARHQAFGPGWSEHRWIYIAPQLVNYRPGAELDTRPRHVNL